VWSDTFTRDLKDIFAVQDEIAGLIAKNISPKLTQAVATTSRQVDPEAFQLYLEGRALAAKAGVESLREAIKLFDRALVREPGFSLARAQAARAFVQLGRWGGMVPREAWDAAKAVLAPALTADPDLPEVLVAQGWLLRTADWKWREAERAFARALEQRPSDTDMLVSMAVLKAGVGESDESLALARRAVELDPLNPATQFDLGLIYRFSDHLPDAERQFRRAIELSPGGQRYRTFLAIALAGLKRFDEAEVLAHNEPDELSRMFVYGLVAAGRGDRPRLLATIAELESKRATLGQLGDYSAYLASMKGAAGDLDGAFAELNRTREARDPSIGWIKVNYLFNPMRGDPRWPEFLRKLGLADDQLK
jgi:serine/threonine-protein kinase